MRKKYEGRLVFRVLVCTAVFALYFLHPESFCVLETGQFFQAFSPLHLLWAVWITDMVLKVFPIPGTLALGAKKHLKAYFVPAAVPAPEEKLRACIRADTRRALGVLFLWIALGVALGSLFKRRILGEKELFLAAVFLYVCDLIFVVVWCPLRDWFLKNRCCTTCRIFNWDHLMMVTPLAGVRSFFCGSLVAAALFVFLLWEYRVYRYPKRFFEGTNDALKCRNCTDLLCKKKRRDKNPDYPL